MGGRDQRTLPEAIATAIQEHEPRLQKVQVVQDTDSKPNKGALRFLVQAEWSNATHEGPQTLAIVADRQLRIEEQDLE